MVWFARGDLIYRDGKSLENSTRKTLSLKNEHSKFVQKMLKIVQKYQTNSTKKARTFQNRAKNTKISTALKNKHKRRVRCVHLFSSLVSDYADSDNEATDYVNYYRKLRKQRHTTKSPFGKIVIG